jgi:hypothetical protein
VPAMAAADFNDLANKAREPRYDAR